MTQRSTFGSDTANSIPSNQGTPNATMCDVADQAKETAGQVADQTKQAARQVIDQARDQATSKLGSQKDNAAAGLNSVAQALRQTGEHLREQDQTGVTSYIDGAADQVEQLSTYLQNHDIGQLVDDVEYFARRRPALFVGGAFVLGILGARFLKSTRQQAAGSSNYPMVRRGVYDQPTSYTSYPRESPYTQGYTRGYQQSPRPAATPYNGGTQPWPTTDAEEQR